MEYAYATCILNESGEEINETNLVAVLEAAGCEVQESRVKAIVAALEDIEISGVTSVDVEEIGADPHHNGGPTDQQDDASPQDSDASTSASTDGSELTAIDTAADSSDQGEAEWDTDPREAAEASPNAAESEWEANEFEPSGAPDDEV